MQANKYLYNRFYTSKTLNNICEGNYIKLPLQNQTETLLTIKQKYSIESLI